MAIYWLTSFDPDETALFTVDWTDEMDAVSDTITGSPTFTFVDANVYGLEIGSIAIASGSKKVNCYISNSDPDSNRTNVLANSPYTITHEIATAGGQTLQRILGLVVAESGSDLTVEDGSSVTGADTYDTLANADLYHVNRGNNVSTLQFAWTGTDTERARMLRRGCDLLDDYMRGRVKGIKSSSGQPLVFPRQSLTDEEGNYIASDTIPNGVKHAQFEMARLANADLDFEGTKSIQRVKAGSVEVEFAQPMEARSILTRVDDLLSPYIRRSGYAIRRGA